MVAESLNLRDIIELISEHKGWIFGPAVRKFIVPRLADGSAIAPVLDPDNTGLNVWFAYDSDWQKFMSAAASKNAKIIVASPRSFIEYKGYTFRLTVGSIFPVIDHDIDGLIFRLDSNHVTWASVTLMKPNQLIRQICDRDCVLLLDRMHRGFSDAWFPYHAPEGFSVYTPALPGQDEVTVNIRCLENKAYATSLCKPYTDIIVPPLGDALLTTTLKYEAADLDAAFTISMSTPTQGNPTQGNPSTRPICTAQPIPFIAAHPITAPNELETYCVGVIHRLVDGLVKFPSGAPESVYVSMGMIVLKEIICACKHLKLPERKQKLIDVLEQLHEHVDKFEPGHAKQTAQKDLIHVVIWIAKIADLNPA